MIRATIELTWGFRRIRRFDRGANVGVRTFDLPIVTSIGTSSLKRGHFDPFDIETVHHDPTLKISDCEGRSERQ